jgi:hypothetical protein
VLDGTSFLKADSQSYQILQTLALQSELYQPVTIREADHKFTPRTTKETYGIDVDIDTPTFELGITIYLVNQGKKRRE